MPGRKPVSGRGEWLSRRGVYLLTPDENDTTRLLARVEVALTAGVAWLQYRNKQADAALRAEQAAALRLLCAHHDVPLLINDDVALARMLGAGVHLGRDDGDIAAARAALGRDAVIGASCYDEAMLATRAAQAGASYVAFGAFYPSSTKPNARRATPDLLRAAASLGVPRVAIGGITPDNARPLIAAGADLVAVIAGVFDAPDPAAAVAAYNACFENPA